MFTCNREQSVTRFSTYTHLETDGRVTWFFCPIRWARAWAWRSFWGFQSESNIMTVSAVARLIPKPPARVDSRKQKSWEHSALKWSRACLLISPLIPPSRRWNGKCRSCKYSARMSSIRTICEKINTRCPVSRKRISSLSNSTSLPDPRISCCEKRHSVQVTQGTQHGLQENT